VRVISDQISAIRKQERLTQRLQRRGVHREEQRKAEKREAAEGFLSTRPDAP
jgi:hypothetical protein